MTCTGTGHTPRLNVYLSSFFTSKDELDNFEEKCAKLNRFRKFKYGSDAIFLDPDPNGPKSPGSGCTTPNLEILFSRAGQIWKAE